MVEGFSAEPCLFLPRTIPLPGQEGARGADEIISASGRVGLASPLSPERREICLNIGHLLSSWGCLLIHGTPSRRGQIRIDGYMYVETLCMSYVGRYETT